MKTYIFVIISLLLSGCGSSYNNYHASPSYSPKISQAEFDAQLKQLENEQQARAAYYASPQGQANLAHQEMLAQQQVMQRQIQEQQRQQEWNQLNQQMQHINQSIQQSNQQIMQMYNNRPKNAACYNALGNINCYSY